MSLIFFSGFLFFFSTFSFLTDRNFAADFPPLQYLSTFGSFAQLSSNCLDFYFFHFWFFHLDLIFIVLLDLVVFRVFCVYSLTVFAANFFGGSAGTLLDAQKFLLDYLFGAVDSLGALVYDLIFFSGILKFQMERFFVSTS